VVGRIAPNIVQKNVCLLAREATANGVWLQSETKQFMPIIYLTDPFGEREAIRVLLGGGFSGSSHVDSLIR
jgi:hypothetical protein